MMSQLCLIDQAAITLGYYSYLVGLALLGARHGNFSHSTTRDNLLHPFPANNLSAGRVHQPLRNHVEKFWAKFQAPLPLLPKSSPNSGNSTRRLLMGELDGMSRKGPAEVWKIPMATISYMRNIRPLRSHKGLFMEEVDLHNKDRQMGHKS
jgi:hypothetical protein